MVGLLYYVIGAASHAGSWTGRVALATSLDHARHWRRGAVANPFNLLTARSNARAGALLGDYIGLARLPHGFAATFPMTKPFARNVIDLFFTRITTSRGR